MAFQMTVGELIATLSTFDANAQVAVWDDDRLECCVPRLAPECGADGVLRVVIEYTAELAWL